MPENKWWDGYTTGQSVIIDDFDDSQFNITFLLQLLDLYPFRVEVCNDVTCNEVTGGNTEPPLQVKGGSLEFDAPTIIITANTDPKTWYPWAKKAHIDALMRRIDKITYYDEPYVYKEKIVSHYPPAPSREEPLLVSDSEDSASEDLYD